ncbi:MAG: hypothetical protein ABIU05_14735 [Nitrospirales bacterium]
MTHLVTQGGLPIQRACQSVGLSRASYYRPVVNWAQRDATIIEALTTLGEARPRWGSGNMWIGCGIPATGGITSGSGGCITTCG